MTHYKYSIILIFSFLIIASCVKRAPNVVLIETFIKAKNTYDAKALNKIIDKNYHELFQNNEFEIEHKEEFFYHLDWAKELSSKTKIIEVIAITDSTVVIIEENSNYMDTALKQSPRNFKTTFYIKNNKIQKQSYDTLPGYDKQDMLSSKLIENFETYAANHDIEFSWESDQKSGESLRKALELYVNRK